MKKLELNTARDRLCFGSEVTISFQRTLRIPDDEAHYPLPPSLGAFPLRRVDDYASRVPASWRERGGVFLPMYQREAMWILFRCPSWKPRAIKVGVGKVCAITGKRWTENLWKKKRRQNYVVSPPQPWLDGIASGEGMIRQFVAMPLGLGYSVEGQITGEEKYGGIQLKVFEPKPGRFPDRPPPPPRARQCSFGPLGAAAPAQPLCAPRRSAGEMGLAAGGRMRQKIYPDPHGLDTWDASRTARLFVHIVNSELWREITGEPPPTTPVTAREYARAGLPWFDLYDEQQRTVRPSKKLAGIKSVKEIDETKSTSPLQDDAPVGTGGAVVSLSLDEVNKSVRDGNW